MTSVEKFNSLDGVKAHRDEIKNIISIAEKEGRIDVRNKLTGLLLKNSNVEYFEIELIEKIRLEREQLGVANNKDIEIIKFKKKPKEAISYLIKHKKGICVSALHRSDVGFVDVVWGENNSKNHGFGLKHIIGKHGREIEQLGFKIEDFIPLVFMFGDFKQLKKKNRIELSGTAFKIIIDKNTATSRNFVLTAFDLRPTWKKTLGGINGMVDGIDFKKSPLYTKPHCVKNKNKQKKSIEQKKVTDSSKKVTDTSKKTKKKTTQLALFGAKGLAGLCKENELFQLASDPNVKKNAPDTFRLKGEIGKFLQDIQRFRMAIVLTGDPHAGKSEFAKQLVNAFLDYGFTCGMFDLEQGGLISKDTQESIARNISKDNLIKLAVAGEAPKGIETVKQFANSFDVILIDSFQKLGIPSTRFDELRTEFPKTIFIVIYQQNGEGGTRGGVASDYDTPIKIKVHKQDDTFVNNYAELQKNRGNKIGLKYNVSKKKVLIDDEPK